jgi:hypothetical protein
MRSQTKNAVRNQTKNTVLIGENGASRKTGCLGNSLTFSGIAPTVLTELEGPVASESPGRTKIHQWDQNGTKQAKTLPTAPTGPK